jgi:hypothetical protein
MRREGRFPALHSVSPALLLIPMAALIVVLPLIVDGCSCGHDFDFHLVSWFEAAAQFRAGTLLPHWAFSPGWNAGEPRFVFYPPLSWVVGALLGTVLPWTAVPVAYTWLALTAAGLGMYRLGRVVAGEGAALLAAMVYVANPYMLFTAYERTAYAELLAAAWIPLLLAAGLRARMTVLGIALPVALLWLTNAPAAVMGCYALGLVAVLRVGLAWRREGSGAVAELAWRMAAGVGFGLGLAAFYVVPAAYERRWVEIAMVMVEGMRYSDNFLFHHTADADHDVVLRTASWIAVGMLGATGALLGGAGIRKSGLAALEGDEARPWIVLGVLAGAIGVTLTPLSAGVWRVAPELAFLQFPWRLLAVLAAVLGVGIALVAARVRVRTAAMLGVMLVVALSWPAARVFRQACDPEDTVQARLAVFQTKAGTDPTDEYTPRNDDNDVLRKDDPAYWLAGSADATAPKGMAAGPVARRFTVVSDRAQMLILNLRAYPAWRVRVNGVLVRPRGERADGLMVVPVPAGRDTIAIAYRRTEDETLGWGISGVAVLLLIGMGWRRRRLPIPRA